MSGKLKTSASIILYLIKTSKLQSNSSWIYWRETVLSVYEKDEQAGKINAEINSGKIVSKKINKIEDILLLIEDISEEDKIEVLSMIELYKIIYENSAEFIPDTLNAELYDEIINKISTNTDTRKNSIKNAVVPTEQC